MRRKRQARRRCGSATKAAERAGASVRPLALPEIVAEAWRVHPVIQEFEAHQALAWEYRENYDAMAPNLRGRLDESKGGTPAEYDAAMAVAGRARHALAKIFDDVDVILTLSAPGAAPKGLGSTGDARYNRLWTLMGVPCVNVPTLIAEGGLPVGVTVIARYGADARALARALRRRRAGAAGLNRRKSCAVIARLCHCHAIAISTNRSGTSPRAHQALTVAEKSSGRSPFQACPTPSTTRAWETGSIW